MTDAVEKVARAWASMDGRPYGEGYVEDAAFLLRRSGVGQRIEELEAKLEKAVELALKECSFSCGTRAYIDWWHDRRTTLAELRGQDDEKRKKGVKT